MPRSTSTKFGRVSLATLARAAGGSLAGAALLCAGLAPLTPRPAQRPAAAAPAARLKAMQWPMQFEANRGQSDSQVRFLARGPAYTMFFTDSETVLTTQSRADAKAGHAPAVLRSRFVGARAVSPQGQAPLATRISYMVGNDADRWTHDVPSFQKVVYPGLYPGIDAVYYGSQGTLEYDLQVAPGADPSAVRLGFSGSGAPKVTDGQLVFAMNGSQAALRRPVAYQTVSGQRRDVGVRYVQQADGSVGFALGAYDRRQALVIDPVLSWATFLGGNNVDAANAVAVDSSGNVYVTGITESTNFPTTSGAYLTTNTKTNFEVFVTEMASTSLTLSYSTYLGGSGDDEAEGIALDSSNNAYITGYTNSSNFPTTSGVFQPLIAPSTGGGNAYNTFVTKLNPTGTALVYSTYLGGNNDTKGAAIAVDSSGDAFLTGYTAATNFPTSAGAPQTTLGGATDAYVSAVNPTATALLYSTYLGGTQNDYGTGIALDLSANAYVTGYTNSSTNSGTGFPVTSASVQSAYAGGYDAFVTKVDRTGRVLDYSTYLGGSKDDVAYAITVDAGDNAYVTGYTDSVNFPATTGAYHTSLDSDDDIFVASINKNGSSLNYATYAGGSANDVGTGIYVDATGSAYVTGYTASLDFPVTSNAQQSASGGGQDAFLIKLDSVGANLLYSTYYGGAQNDEASGIAADANGDIYFVGFTLSGNFPATTGVYQAAAASSEDAFVTKFITAPQGVFNPSSLSFPAQAVAVASAAESVIFSNGGEKNLVVTNIATAGPFTQTNNCPTTLTPAQTCTINLVYTPTASGGSTGSLTVTDNGPTGSQALPLTGTGGDFTLAVSPTTQTVTNGSSASFALTVTPTAGYVQVVTLTCPGTMPEGVTCTPSPTSLTMDGTTASTATYTVTTTTRTSGLPGAPSGPAGPRPWLWLLLPALGLMVLALRRRHNGLRWAGGLAFAGMLAAFAAGCGGTTTGGTPAGNYTLTFTGAAPQTGATNATTETHNVTVTLTVN